MDNTLETSHRYSAWQANAYAVVDYESHGKVDTTYLNAVKKEDGGC